MIWLCVFFVVVMPIPWFFLYRNNWVHKERIRILEEDSRNTTNLIESHKFKRGDSFHPRYESLPSYDRMLFMFWVWDANEFIGYKP